MPGLVVYGGLSASGSVAFGASDFVGMGFALMGTVGQAVFMVWVQVRLLPDNASPATSNTTLAICCSGHSYLSLVCSCEKSCRSLEHSGS